MIALSKVRLITLKNVFKRQQHNIVQSRIRRAEEVRKQMNVIKQQPFQYYLVLDFEATCEKQKKLNPQEIIEFPVLKVNGKTFEVEDKFHSYVQPDVNKELTSFCTELTGIVQSMVDDQPNLVQVLSMFTKWKYEQGLTCENSVFVTCGDWDLNLMLPNQCDYLGISISKHFHQWVNIKKVFSHVMGRFPKGMMTMLSMLNLEHCGRHHSGIDDCINIASILKDLAEKGAIIDITMKK